MATRARRVVWTRRALDGLHEILEFVSRDSPGGARALCASILQSAATLSTLSERGRIIPEIGSSVIRETIVKRYRLIYEVRSDEVIILAVIHGARDFSRWRQEQ